MTDQQTTACETRVIYNGTCPVCSTEIDHYRSYAEARGLPLAFDDLHDTDLSRYGLSRDDAARRLCVARAGTLHCGIDGFLLLWREMPRYRWLARIVGLPGVRQVADIVYDHVLAPLLYRMHLRRERKQSV